MAFTQPVDIANRALQIVGARLIDTLADDTKGAHQVSFAYPKLLAAELRRTVWRFATKRAVLRPYTATTKRFIPGAWALSTDYTIGNIVQDTAGLYWVCMVDNPIMLRFVADVQSVPEFDQLFAIGLATRLAIELAPRLADTEQLATIISVAREEYARTISEARTINGIETGPVDPYEDDYISARL